ncbi:MAG: cell division protein FtsQ/DivIB [bacterium]
MRKHKGLAQQLSERKNRWRSKKGRKRIIKAYLKFFIRLFVLILLILGIWGIIRLPFFFTTATCFQVKKAAIILEDNGLIEKEEVVNTYKEFCLTNYSCLHPNIFKLNFTGLKNALLKNPKIEEVMIQRKFPQGIVIKAKSRKAVAKILINSSVFGVDKSLVAFKMKDKPDLPVITGIGTLKTDKPLLNSRLKEALLIISKIKEYKIELLHNISNIDISNQYDIVMITKIGATKIHLGYELEPKRLVERLKELETILKHFQQNNQIAPEYIDLRFDNIIVKDK